MDTSSQDIDHSQADILSLHTRPTSAQVPDSAYLAPSSSSSSSTTSFSFPSSSCASSSSSPSSSSSSLRIPTSPAPSESIITTPITSPSPSSCATIPVTPASPKKSYAAAFHLPPLSASYPSSPSSRSSSSSSPAPLSSHAFASPSESMEAKEASEKEEAKHGEAEGEGEAHDEEEPGEIAEEEDDEEPHDIDTSETESSVSSFFSDIYSQPTPSSASRVLFPACSSSSPSSSSSSSSIISTPLHKWKILHRFFQALKLRPHSPSSASSSFFKAGRFCLIRVLSYILLFFFLIPLLYLLFSSIKLPDNSPSYLLKKVIPVRFSAVSPARAPASSPSRASSPCSSDASVTFVEMQNQSTEEEVQPEATEQTEDATIQEERAASLRARVLEAFGDLQEDVLSRLNSNYVGTEGLDEEEEVERERVEKSEAPITSVEEVNANEAATAPIQDQEKKTSALESLHKPSSLPPSSESESASSGKTPLTSAQTIGRSSSSFSATAKAQQELDRDLVDLRRAADEFTLTLQQLRHLLNPVKKRKFRLQEEVDAEEDDKIEEENDAQRAKDETFSEVAEVWPSDKEQIPVLALSPTEIALETHALLNRLNMLAEYVQKRSHNLEADWIKDEDLLKEFEPRLPFSSSPSWFSLSSVLPSLRYVWSFVRVKIVGKLAEELRTDLLLLREHLRHQTASLSEAMKHDLNVLQVEMNHLSEEMKKAMKVTAQMPELSDMREFVA